MSKRVLTYEEIEAYVAKAYAIELRRLMGDNVKVTPDRIASISGPDAPLATRHMRTDGEVVKIVSRIAFLNYAMHAALDHIVSATVQPKAPLTKATLERLCHELSSLRSDRSGLADLHSFINALVIWSLGKSDSLVRPRMRELGVIAESPEERAMIVLGLSPDIVPCLADTNTEVLTLLRAAAELSFTLSHVVQGEGPAACVFGLRMNPEQRRWYALHGLVCAAGASGMSRAGFSVPTESLVDRYLDALHHFGQDVEPVVAYFQFMLAQMLKMGLAASAAACSPKLLPLARLILHARTIDDDDLAQLKCAWENLPPSTKEPLHAGLLETGVTSDVLARALPPAWRTQLHELGTDSIATMIQYSPSLLNNACAGGAGVVSEAEYTRGYTLLAAHHEEGRKLAQRKGLTGAGIFRIDAQQAAETVRENPTFAKVRLFLLERQSRGDGVRLDAVSYTGPEDLARLEALVDHGTLECKLLQIFRENMLSDREVGNAESDCNLLPSAIFRNPPKRVVGPHLNWARFPVHQDFAVTPAIRDAFGPILEVFSAQAEKDFGSHQRIRGGLAPNLQRGVDRLRDALACAAKPLGLDSEKRFRSFIGFLDERAAAASPQNPSDNYGLRRMTLAAGRGAIKSWHAFTYAKRFQQEPDIDWEFVADRHNWLPERLKVQTQLINHAFISALRTSSQLKLREPKETGAKAHEIVAYYMSGGFGSGKTTMMHNIFGFNVHRIGSDPFKEYLTAQIDGFLPFELVHDECSGIAYDFTYDVMRNMRGVYLVDASLARAYDARRALDAMHGQGILHIMGLHVPLHVSLLRVLGRRVVDRNDPRIPAQAAIAGWKRTVEGRPEVCKVIEEDPQDATCELYISDTTGADYKRVATIKHGKTSIVDALRWNDAINVLSPEEVEALSERTVRDLLHDRKIVAEDAAVLLDAKFEGRPVAWNELNEREQRSLRSRDGGASERKGLVDFRDLPLGVALDVNARRQQAWPGEMAKTDAA